ncbi:MAG: hypothetical protein Fur0040_07130 [Sideroxydans sp.]
MLVAALRPFHQLLIYLSVTHAVFMISGHSAWRASITGWVRSVSLWTFPGRHHDALQALLRRGMDKASKK